MVSLGQLHGLMLRSGYSQAEGLLKDFCVSSRLSYHHSRQHLLASSIHHRRSRYAARKAHACRRVACQTAATLARLAAVSSESVCSHGIRRANKLDLQQMQDIENLSKGFWTANEFKAELSQERSVLLVAECAGTIQGLALVWCIADEAQILEIAVHPSNRRQGIAQSLLQEALAICCKRILNKYDRGKAVLEVGVSNAGARCLYTKLGFAETGYRAGYYPDGTDAVLMTLVLDSHKYPQ